MAATEGTKECIWLQGFVKELRIGQGEMVIYCDNQSALHFMKNLMYHERSKHIDIKMHFIREVIKKGDSQGGKDGL